MRIYTRGGDDGETGLLGNRRVSKADPLIEAIGQLDELNAWIGLLLTNVRDARLSALLMQVQRDLFEMGAELASPEPDSHLPLDRISQIEREIDFLSNSLPPLRHFILPGGDRAGALCHVVRAVARRSERAVAALPRSASLNPAISAYLNRLSDFLFVVARHLNHQSGKAETIWTRDAPHGGSPE